MNFKILPFFCLLAYPLTGISQSDIPVGTWRTHFNYSNVKCIEIAGEKIYASSKNGFFYFDQSDNSINRQTKLDGYSDTGIGAMAYNEADDLLTIGYRNGNIDFLKENTIINQDAILNADIYSPKEIYHVGYHNNDIYVSTGTGVVVFDRDNFDIAENYINIGPEGSSISVFQTTFYNDSIFIATDNGVLGASLTGYNLQDFNNWHQFVSDEGIPVMSFPHIITDGNRLIALSSNNLLYEKSENSWQLYDKQYPSPVNFIGFSNNNLIVCRDGEIHLVNGDSETTITKGISRPVSAMFDNQSQLWIGDKDLGLLKQIPNGTEVFTPSGPYSDETFRLKYMNNTIFALSGRYNKDFVPQRIDDGFFVFDNGTWRNYNSSGLKNTVRTPVIHDLIDVAFNNERYMFASFSDGLLSWDGNNTFEIIDDESPGSLLQTASSNSSYTQTAGIATDRSGNFWLTNHDTSTPFLSLDPEGVWSERPVSQTVARYCTDIIVTDRNDKWALINPVKGTSGDIIVFNDEYSRRLNSIEGNGGIPGDTITSIIKDSEGKIWIGTEDGPAYFPNPDLALYYVSEGQNTGFNYVNVQRPYYNEKVFLNGERINCIASDPGSRIWIGTNKGVWLYGSNTEQVYYEFNSDNSPLPSDIILDIAVNAESGEVFFATDRGLASFRSTSTTGKATHSEVKVFPNPVRPDFNNLLMITGLVQFGEVKITDVSGNLVYQSRAQGGSLSWDLTDVRGKKVSSGVYLIFSSNDDGSETFVGKFAVIK